MSRSNLEEIYFDDQDHTCKTIDGRIVNPIVKSPLVVFQTDDDFEVGPNIYEHDGEFERRKQYVKERKSLHADIQLGDLENFHLVSKGEINAYMLCKKVAPFTMTLSYSNGCRSEGTNAASIQFYKI